MNILWVTGRRFGKDLCQTTQVQVGKALVRRGCKVTFLCPKGEGVKSWLNENGLESLDRLDVSAIHGFQSVSLMSQVKKNLQGALTAIAPDLVICDWRASLGAYKILIEAQIPWVMVDRGPPAHSGLLAKLQKFHYSKSWKKAGRRADITLAVSKAHVKYLIKKFRLKKPPLMISAAADPEAFMARETSSNEKPGINRPLHLVYHGRLDLSRDVVDLVHVTDQLRQSGIESTIRMFGSGTAWKSLEKLSTRFDWFELLGNQKPADVPGLLTDMDVGLLPMDGRLAWRTASPLKLFEYAASGLSVVATDIEAHRLDNEPIWISTIPVKQRIEGMVRQLQSLVTEEKIIGLGGEARRDVENLYNWDNAVSDAIEAMTDLVHASNSS